MTTEPSHPTALSPLGGTRGSHAEALGAPTRASRRRFIGPLVFFAIFAAALGGVVWGAVFADPEVYVQQVDAGPSDRFAVGEVTAYPEYNFYMLALDNGYLRAVDGLVPGERCAVELVRDDERGRAKNPRGVAGVYRDPCSGGVWAITGDALEGTSEPLKTFFVSYRHDDAGVQHAWVEVLGKRTPSRTP